MREIQLLTVAAMSLARDIIVSSKAPTKSYGWSITRSGMPKKTSTAFLRWTRCGSTIKESFTRPCRETRTSQRREKPQASFRHRAAGEPPRRPCRLKIKATGDAVNIEQLAGKIQPGTDSALHGFEVYLAQPHAAT